jgi:hypothetical protein
VHQQDLLVGMFHNECDAHNYKNELETLEMRRQASSSYSEALLQPYHIRSSGIW